MKKYLKVIRRNDFEVILVDGYDVDDGSFVSKNKDNWGVYDKETGVLINFGKTKKEAIEKYYQVIPEVERIRKTKHYEELLERTSKLKEKFYGKESL